jgi:superfamily II DNA or RNA helicase
MAIEWLSEDRLPAYVIGPPKVIKFTWPDQILKWNSNVTYHVYSGVNDNEFDKMSEVDVILISHASVGTFVENLSAWCKRDKRKIGRRSLIVDEAHNYKGGKKRFKHLKSLLSACNENRLLMSATPKTKDAQDLWSQMYLLDNGVTLGKTKTAFREKFCEAYFRPTCPIALWRVVDDNLIDELTAHYFETAEFIGDEWPNESYYTIRGRLNGQANEVFYKILKDGVDEWHEEPCASYTSKLIRMWQVQQGFIYDDSKNVVILDGSPKDDHLLEVIERHPDENIMCIVHFRAEAFMLRDKFNCPILIGGTSDNLVAETLDKWNSGNVPLLVVQYSTVDEGLNLQHGGSVIFWRIIPMAMKTITQMNGRLLRRGQTKNVSIYYSIIDNYKSIDKFCIDLCNDKGAKSQNLTDKIIKFMENRK